VLEEVREARSTALLVSSTDVVDDVRGDRRRRVIHGHDDAKTVIELGLSHVDLELVVRERDGRKKQ
jgi:hypothetical protein